jgi:hypothetical protein
MPIPAISPAKIAKILNGTEIINRKSKKKLQPVKQFMQDKAFKGKTVTFFSIKNMKNLRTE